MTAALAFMSIFAAASAKAQLTGSFTENFTLNSTTLVNPDLGAGMVTVQGYGLNAAATSVITEATMVNDVTGIPNILNTRTFISGYFGRQGDNLGTYYDFLEDQGLMSSSSIALTQVSVHTIVGDTWYEYDSPVNITAFAHAGMIRMSGDVMIGFGDFTASVQANGAMPVFSSVDVVEFTNPHPSWEPDWRISMYTQWVVTENFHPIPAPTPGSMVMLGLARLLVCRRRR